MATGKAPTGPLYDPYEPDLLDVKFREGTRIRVLDTRITAHYHECIAISALAY